MDTAEILVLLLASVAALALLAQRLTIPYPILLVLGGLAISFVPGLPSVRLSPELALLIFLPPLLYAQAWMTPWREFCKYRRPIFLLAVGLVLFTTTAVAFAAHALMGLPLASGFVLGAIVSPPDAVAASAIAERFSLPRRVVAVLEGESLVNDATGLVAYKFAVAAVLTGTFSLAQAGLHFVLVAAGGVALGWMVGWGSARVFERVKDEAVLITFSLLVPYVGYLAAERLHVSGVLTAVTSGLYLGRRAPQMLNASTRLQAGAFWDMLVFLLNSIVFLLIGLQLPSIRANLSSYTVPTLLGYAAATCLVVMLVRPIWVFPGAYLPRWFSRRIRETESDPGWRNVLIVGWSGMRGVVSLAAALALPALTTQGERFPGRDLVVFLTFAVILGTLVGQGLTLGPLIKWLGVRPDRHEEKEEIKTRLALAEAAQFRIAQLAQEAKLPESAINALRVKYENRIAHLTDEQAHVLGWSSRREELVAGRRLRREALAAERRKLLELRHRGEVADELLHKLQHELDLEEARIT
ncbi:MAG TPA: Na+/H+ antiporter [Haliangiales bacterium]|nr:Na+/H+ antiporter [Haliangiales bacterium]